MKKAVLKKEKTKLYVLLFVILATLAFVWGNSIQSAEKSSQTSEKVFEIVEPVFELFVGAGNATEQHVRKAAHFLQFGLLGCELALLLIMTNRVKVQGVANTAFFGLGVAVVDETIQIFSMRGPQVSDILIDFGGLCTGLLTVILLYSIFKTKKSVKPSQHSAS